jgi:hypothetical protein
MTNISYITRLSFESVDEWNKFHLDNKKTLDQIWLWHETLGDKEGLIQYPGICQICDINTSFTSKSHKNTRINENVHFKNQVNWWAQSNCHCSLSNLERAALSVFFETYEKGCRVYHVGHYSLFRQWLAERLEHLTSSQFFLGKAQGEVVDGVRHEDISRLTFQDKSFDRLFCMEILEHVPDYETALLEMARVLKENGRAILSFPWLGRNTYENLIRAEMMGDGTINHILEPEYHGDPAKSEGILSFRSFGWQILDDMREAGFKRASAEFIFSPLHGFMTLQNPVVVGVR